MVYLPLSQVADTPFRIQRDGISCKQIELTERLLPFYLDTGRYWLSVILMTGVCILPVHAWLMSGASGAGSGN